MASYIYYTEYLTILLKKDGADYETWTGVLKSHHSSSSLSTGNFNTEF